jgi:hypothetical protein
MALASKTKKKSFIASTPETVDPPPPPMMSIAIVERSVLGLVYTYDHS